MNPASRLVPFLREYIYGKKWPSLRRIQEETINEVFDGSGHILIASGTASGKTEAAFLPLVSLLAEASSVRGGAAPLVLYISPLKALINDQFERLRTLAAGSEGSAREVRIWRWHGDVSVNHKKEFLAAPRGVLLITPESLEALLLRRAEDIKTIFAGLVFAVIDEVHAFMGSERGSQLVCQLARIEAALTDSAPADRRGCRRIGLSATLGDYDGGRAWLSQGTGMPAALVSEKSGRRNLSLAVDYFRDGGAFYEVLYRQCRDRRAIIFTNSRLEAEECVTSLRRAAAAAGEPDIFRIHHGSIAAPLRGEAEEKLKHSEGPSVTAATATLELGIDIGDLDRIVQIGPPWSVSAFVQRLGRSGRRGGRPEMYFTVMDPPAASGDFFTDPGRPQSALEAGLSGIPWDLLRTVAVVELYLAGQWIEPPSEKPLPYSLFAHELLALLASGEHSPALLRRRLFTMPPFASSSITEDDFILLVRHFINCDYIEKTGGGGEDGGFILGLEGEKITGRHSFFSVFPGEETFRVLLEGREIGTVHFAAPPGNVITVAGRTWLVDSVDGARREIRVRESAISEIPGGTQWQGGGGVIHDRVVETVRCVLAGGGSEGGSADTLYGADACGSRAGPAVFAALSPSAREAVERGRRIARDTGILERAVNAAPRKAGDTFTRLFITPWLGGSGMRTLDAFFRNGAARKKLGLLYAEWDGFYFRAGTRLDEDTFAAALKEAAAQVVEESAAGSMAFVPEIIPLTDKYDYLLPHELIVKQYAANMLDPKALSTLADSAAAKVS